MQKVNKKVLTEVGFEPTPFRTAALTQRLRPLGHSALLTQTGSFENIKEWVGKKVGTNACCSYR